MHRPWQGWMTLQPRLPPLSAPTNENDSSTNTTQTSPPPGLYIFRTTAENAGNYPAPGTVFRSLSRGCRCGSRCRVLWVRGLGAW